MSTEKTLRVVADITVTLEDGQELTSEGLARFLEEAGARVNAVYVTEQSKYGTIYR